MGQGSPYWFNYVVYVLRSKLLLHGRCMGTVFANLNIDCLFFNVCHFYLNYFVKIIFISFSFRADMFLLSISFRSMSLLWLSEDVTHTGCMFRIPSFMSLDLCAR